MSLNHSNIKSDDPTASVLAFTTGLAWQEKHLTRQPTRLQGLRIALPKVADVAKEEVVDPQIETPHPDEKPRGETRKDLGAQPVMPA
ncbi:hypothetical protein ACQWF4_22370, partial [Salmonella enterica subsp. enterica serovar Infantis]